MSKNICKNKKEKGFEAEALVCSLLERQGFIILKKNWRTPFCEVDIVATKGKTLFIFEVKGREKLSPFPLVSHQQQRRLSQGAMWIWQQNRQKFKFFRCRVLQVTQGNIKIRNLPLLYDTT